MALSEDIDAQMNIIKHSIGLLMLSKLLLVTVHEWHASLEKGI